MLERKIRFISFSGNLNYPKLKDIKSWHSFQVQLKNIDKNSKVRKNKFKDTFCSLMV